MQEQSNKQFYISDWHYGHANVIAFDNRPFKSLLEMDEALVDRWNAVVSPGDTVYVLGDMFWCKAQDAIPILHSLKGTMTGAMTTNSYGSLLKSQSISK